MGFKTADMPPVDPAQFDSMPFMDRMRMLATHWAEYGFGSPKQLHMLYVYKLIFYVLGGVAIVGLTTPGLGGFGHLASWWGEPIVYQKLMVWTVLFEILGLASSSGPLAFKFSPFIGGCLYWTRRKTLRLPPWPGKVPFTAGDERTTFDVTLYSVILALLGFLLLGPGVRTSALPGSDAGLLPQWGLTGESYTETAALMRLHRNTVKYRVTKAHEERDTAISSNRVDLAVALNVCHFLGAAVLTGPTER